MNKGRLEAFSDGVLAVIITIMVLELKMPHGASLAALKSVIPVLLSYILSFVYVGIYWNNHHRLLHASQRVNGATLWANLHLLFWLSLIPFTTAWMGENHISSWPVAVYGTVLLLAGTAYFQDPHQASWTQFNSIGVHWTRQEKQDLNRDLRNGNSTCIRTALDCQPVLRDCGHHVAGSGPAHRAEDGAVIRIPVVHGQLAFFSASNRSEQM
jgi:uncharacterized membrane protein